jgi:hypothetical protein
VAPAKGICVTDHALSRLYLNKVEGDSDFRSLLPRHGECLGFGRLSMRLGARDFVHDSFSLLLIAKPSRPTILSMTDLEQIPVPADSLRKMLELLQAMIREGARQDRIELVELSERCKALVEDALRRGTN